MNIKYKKVFLGGSRVVIATLVILIQGVQGKGQDIQLTQYYNASQYLNPAFVGTFYAFRMVADTRLQWPALDAKYYTYYLSADYNLEKFNSGVGGYIINDNQGGVIYKETEVALQYATWVNLNYNFSLRAGIQGSYNNLSIDYQHLSFPSQYNTSALDYNTTAIPNSLKDVGSANYFDVGSGLLFYSDQIWFGYSFYHINKPVKGLINNPEKARSNFRHAIIGGYRFKYNIGRKVNLYSYNFHVIPTFLYKKQAKSDQLDLGLYFQYEDILCGLWYRGIPVKNYNNDLNNLNNESLIFLAGVRFESFSVAYSYDLVISKLVSSGGAHEISLIFRYPPESKFVSKHKKYKAVPCPKLEKYPK